MAETTVSQAEKKEEPVSVSAVAERRSVRRGRFGIFLDCHRTSGHRNYYDVFCQLRMGDFRGFRGQLLRKRTD